MLHFDLVVVCCMLLYFCCCAWWKVTLHKGQTNMRAHEQCYYYFYHIAKLVHFIWIFLSIILFFFFYLELQLASQLAAHSNRVQCPSYVTNLLELSCFSLTPTLYPPSPSPSIVIVVMRHICSVRETVRQRVRLSLVYETALHMGKN